MADVRDYLELRGDITLGERPFNDVDNLALATLAYLDFSGIVGGPGEPGVRLTDACGELLARAGGDLASRVRSLATVDERFVVAIGGSARLGDAVLRDYVDERDDERVMQFSAVTAELGGGETYVAFRGTDTTLVGWREDFALSFSVTGAQRAAAVYLRRELERARPEGRRVRVGGHSKGGNLATYAALMAPEGVRARIERVFDHDGPGFKPGFLDEKDFEPVRDLVHRTVPEESVVGMLMDTPIEPHVVRSSARGAEQHSVFTWEVDGDDFAYADGLSPSAVFTHDLMDDWLSSLSEEETPRVVDALFRAIEASGARSFGEVIFSGPDTPTLIGEAARNLDQESRDILTPALAKLAASAARAGAKGLSELF